jgi:negative regulator of sigma E activity
MDCEKCQDLLSAYIDGELTVDDRRQLSAHLQECLPCFSVREDLHAIVGYCREHRGEYDPVPSSQAMWIRIRNTVEAEGLASSARVAVATEKSSGILSRVFHASWQMTFPQLAATACAIAIAVSLATTLGIQRLRSMSETGENPAALTHSSSPDVRPDYRTRQQQMDISYWNQRVELRKVKWSPQVRDAFERNLNVIDKAVDESRQQLIQNPHDEVSEELFNAALSEKMELLKDFSEQ